MPVCFDASCILCSIINKHGLDHANTHSDEWVIDPENNAASMPQVYMKPHTANRFTLYYESVT